MNKFLLLKMALRRGDRTMSRQVFYQISGGRLTSIDLTKMSEFLLTHFVTMKAKCGDKFIVTDAEIGEVHNGLPVLSTSDLQRVMELCHE